MKEVPDASVARTGAAEVVDAGCVVVVGRVTRGRVVVVGAPEVLRPPCPWFWVITTTTAITVAVAISASRSCRREPGATSRDGRAGAGSYAGRLGLPGVAGAFTAPGASVDRPSAERERAVASCTALSVRR